MKSQKTVSLFRGLAALMAVLFVLSSLGQGLTENYRNQIDGMLGTSSYVTINDEEAARFKKDYATIEDMAAAAKEIAIREGEEGTVIMKNDNSVLPLSKDNEVVLFGLAAYAPYPYANGDLKAGNADAVDLVAALENAGLTINETVKNFYLNNILNNRNGAQPLDGRTAGVRGLRQHLRGFPRRHGPVPDRGSAPVPV